MKLKSFGLGSIKILIIFMIAVFSFAGCAGCNAVKNIPPGYVGKMLTPKGWDSKILEAGQIDIGKEDNDGTGNKLVLLEATSVTIKEQFLDKDSPFNKDKQDHRIMLGGMVPVEVDVYTQVMVPTDTKLRDAIFAQVTPTNIKDDDRVFIIHLQDVYDKFAGLNIRGNVRAIFAKYNSYEEVMKNYDKVDAEIASMVIQVFKDNNVPLQLRSCKLSNVKPDEQIWAATNKQIAANAEIQTIEKVGDAMRKNPGYLEFKKWETIEKIAGKGTSLTFIVGDQKPVYTVPLSK